MRTSPDRSTPVRLAAGALVLAVLPTVACAGGGGAVTPDAGAAAEEEPAPVLVGVTTREAIEEAEPAWVARTVEAEVDAEAAAALAAVEPGAELTILLGTWCGDSRREVSRFWKALDQVPKLVDAYMEGRIDVESFVTHNMGLDDINKAFDLMHEGSSIRAVVDLT
jgi:hypothetical protein